MGRRGKWRSLRLQYGAVVLFGATAVLLIALGTWWTVFIHGTVDGQHRMVLQALQTGARVHALELAGETRSLGEGPLPGDPNYELIRVHGVPALPAALIGPLPVDARQGVRFAVRPRPALLQDIEIRHDRRQLMMNGEGTLLFSLLLAVLAMLFRLVRSERRFRSEMQEFLGRVTHEMKTPLAGIKAVLQTLEAGRMPPDQARELVHMALQQTEREEHLIQNLLLAQRLRLPEQTLAHENVDLYALLDRFVDHRQETIVGHGAELVLECPDGLRLDGDPTAVWTILENLADNALKYGGKRLRIKAHRESARVVLRFSDDGIGFDPHRAEQLFESYVRGFGRGSKAHGTGLGLHLARGLAERMSGTLRAHSDGEGRGATFILKLPIHDPDGGAQPTAASAHPKVS